MMSDDMTLVREYAQSNSEQAFATLVSQHINLVCSVALRRVHDPHLAEEITQAVFIVLARKAKSLSPKTILSGWLCRTARNVSANTLKIQRRRQLREQESHMQSILNESDSDAWSQIAPLLDEALNCLGEKEHDAVVLRFFDGKELKQVGAAMGTTEDAARMRVNRGVERLREFLTKKGVTLSATALTGAVAANSVQAAPAGLAGSVAGIALASAAASGGITATLVKLAATTKLKLCFISVLALASATAPFVIQFHAQAKLREKEEWLRQQNDQLAQQVEDNQRLSNLLAGTKSSTLSTDQFSELLKLRGEVGRLRMRVQELAQSKRGTSTSGKELLTSPQKLWAARLDQLKQWLEGNPSEKIPELQFLTDRDWLNSIYPHTFATPEEYSQAMSMVRANAQGRIMQKLQAAFRQYARSNNGQRPTDLSQLNSYLDSPIGDAILQRYEIVAATNLVRELQRFGDWVITQKAPVNEELDVRFAFGLDTGDQADSRVTNRWIFAH
jgi:RNA polymerase sigma factor (sigma-70 family)